MKIEPVETLLKRICGKLKSAWSLQVGFETRLQSLLVETAALSPIEIDRHFESVVKGDPIRKMAMVLIAIEHLYHPSLHHRIPEWLADESLPYRNWVLRAIGYFQLRAFAPNLNPFFVSKGQFDRSEALIAATKLKAAANYEVLRQLFDEGQTSIAGTLRVFPHFDPAPTFRKEFREARVIDQIAACESYVSGAINSVELFDLNYEADAIWRCAERYAEYAKEEVFEFLLQHLDFDETWFSSQKISMTIVCRGRVATTIIARANGWYVDDGEQTREYHQRANDFIDRLWRALRAKPGLAFGSECPVSYNYPPHHKIRPTIADLISKHGRVIDEDPEGRFTLRTTPDGRNCVMAIAKPYWRFVRLSDCDRKQLADGVLRSVDLYYRFSSRSGLVAFTDQIILNANDIENKVVKRLIRKREKQREKAELKANPERRKTGEFKQ